MISVTIDNRLRVRKRDLPPGHEAQIKQRLTVANGEKAAARKRQQWGWQELPDSFALYEDEGPILVMPRGFAAELRAGLTMAGHEVRWEDHTAATSLRFGEFVLEGPTLRPDQEEACSALLLHRQGVLQAPTSAGKTVLILEAWRRTGLRGLVLVEKAGLAKQWRERAQEHLGVEVGMIGEGEWEERNLTVAMLQTLHRREIGDEWFRRWGFTALDEAHHARADTYQAVLRRVVSRYLIGVTATPLEGMWEQPFLTLTIGPIVHITSPDELRRQGLRVVPTIRRVRTGWHWAPQNAREKNLVDPKTIYARVIKQLGDSLDRVGIIAQTIIDQPQTCAQLVVSKRLAYLDRIRVALEFGGYEGEIYMMRGSESGDQRAEVARAADAGGCVILATVADEGVDIPRLDRLHLTWPQRQELGLVQQLGRVLRTHPAKREVVVYDYVDDEGMLVSQATARMRVYRKFGYPVEEVRLQGSLTP
jgi:superfamily II DNA or RNA helicase